MNSYSEGRRSHRSRGGATQSKSRRFRDRQEVAKTQKKHSGNGLPNFFETAGKKENSSAAAQWFAAFATAAQTRAH